MGMLDVTNRETSSKLRKTSQRILIALYGLVPKGLRLMLEPKIGNHDQNFLGNWYSKLKQFPYHQ